MALLFVDGFDHYDTADFSKKYNSTAGSPSISAGNGRRSTAGVATMTTSTGLTKNFAANSAWVMGCSLKVGALPSAGEWASIFVLFDAGNRQCELRVNADGTLTVARFNVPVTGGTSVTALTVGTTYYIEWKVTIANSIAANSCKVRIGGVDAITVATGQDLQDSGVSTATQVRLGNVSSSGSMGGSTYIDDFYVCDQTGSVNNDFLGDVRVDTLLPNGEGTHLDYTPSTGTTHYTLVDETAPNTTDYNESGTAGHRDSYQMTNLTAASGGIKGVQVLAAALKDDVGARSIKVGVRSGGTTTVGTTQALATTQAYYTAVHETDPATTAAWTESGINAVESAVETV